MNDTSRKESSFECIDESFFVGCCRVEDVEDQGSRGGCGVRGRVRDLERVEAEGFGLGGGEEPAVWVACVAVKVEAVLCQDGEVQL
jgi:hypothetical protein